MNFSLNRLLAVALTCVAVTACGGGGGSSVGSANGTTATSVTNDAPSILAQLEKQGTLPVLNRDSSIAGVVTNTNKIRDDINSYIAALPDSTVQKKALVQTASAYQGSLVVDTKNETALQAADASIVNSISCLHAQYDSATASQKVLVLEKLTVNTKARFTAYEAFNSAMSGSVTDLPAAGAGCAN